MKPSLPQGTRDFAPAVVRKRQYILQVIRQVFEKYGFQPLETPAMENLETLMGKYGDEGDRLIFKILNNGLDHEKKTDQARVDFEKVLEGKSVKTITERALRYDLTIPFARYVAMNHGQLTFPFKRYQVQPVWRADSPQKGRYREFHQCDADVVGSNSLVNEVEFVCIYMEVFSTLGLPIEIRINNRKMLAALANACGGADKLIPITVAIDKLDKIGIEKVKLELERSGLAANQVELIEKYLRIEGTTGEKLTQVESLLGTEDFCQQALKEFQYILGYKDSIQNPGSLQIDFTLARGLNYYTGIIYEVKAVGVQMGSIGGGGRYDDLTGLFDVPGIPGVGISFGVDRIYDVMEELKLFPEALLNSTQLLFFNLGEQESKIAFNILQKVRSKGISAEIFHESTKFDKQFRYAEKKNIPFVAIIGTREIEEGNVVIKELSSGKQTSIPANDVADFISQK